MVGTSRAVERERGLQRSGYEPALCFVTDGDADKLVESMMTRLYTISDTAYESLLPSYKDVLACLKERASVWNEVAATAHNDDQNEEKRVNPYKTLERQLQSMATPTSSTRV